MIYRYFAPLISIFNAFPITINGNSYCFSSISSLTSCPTAVAPTWETTKTGYPMKGNIILFGLSDNLSLNVQSLLYEISCHGLFLWSPLLPDLLLEHLNQLSY